MTEGQNRTQGGRLILFTTLWLTLFVLSLEVSAAWATRSLSLMAESLHTLLTSFSTFLSLLKITAPYRSRGSPVYGHGKRETIITFLIIAFLGFFGLNLLIMSAMQLIAITHREILAFPVMVSFPLMQLLGIVVGTSLALALLGFYQAKILSNPVLRFNASQLFKDVVLTLLVLAGLMGVEWGFVWCDAILAILLVLLAGGSCFSILSWQLPLLVQQTAIAPEVLAQIVHHVGGITHCYKIQSRGIVGRFVSVQMHLILHPEFTEATSLIVERIEEAIQERYGPVQVTFYIDDDFTKLATLSYSDSVPGVNGKNDAQGGE